MHTRQVDRRRALALMRKNPVMSDRAIAQRFGVSNKTISRWRAEEGIPRGLLPGAITTGEVITSAAAADVTLTNRKLLRWHKLGLLPSWAAFRVYPGHGSETYWAPLVIGQAVEIDRLLRRHRTTRDAVIGLVAGGFDVDDQVARRAYRNFIRAMRDRELLVPRLETSKNARAQLRRRSLWGSRFWLDYSIAEHGITALSAYARRVEELRLSGPVDKHDVLSDQIEATVRVLSGDLFRWDRRDDFANAVAEPPRRMIDQLHRRLSSQELIRVVATADRATLHDAAISFGACFLQFAYEVLKRAESEGSSMYGDLEQTRRWHSLYREVLLEDPVIPARFVPFLVALADSEILEPALGSLFVAAAVRFPDWRAMTLALYTWPASAWGDWRSSLQV